MCACSDVDASMEALAGMSSLLELQICESDVSDEGLAALSVLPLMHTLDITRCRNMTYAGAKAAMRRFRSLRTLYLSKDDKAEEVLWL